MEYENVQQANFVARIKLVVIQNGIESNPDSDNSIGGDGDCRHGILPNVPDLDGMGFVQSSTDRQLITANFTKMFQIFKKIK